MVPSTKRFTKEILVFIVVLLILFYEIKIPHHGATWYLGLVEIVKSVKAATSSTLK